MKRAAIAALITVFLTPAYAKDVKPALVLQDIQAVKLNEKKGDEVYINVTEYLPDGKSKSTNIPVLPLAWGSKDLSKVKELKLWDAKMTNGQAADVIVTFVEQDNPPFDPDDLLGVVQLKLVNTKQGIKPLWSVKEGVIDKKTAKSNQGTFKEVSNNKNYDFTLKGSNAEYKVKLKLVE